MTVIRRAEPADLDAIVALEATVFGEQAWSPRSIEAEFEQLGLSREIIVATSGAEVVGYAVLMHAGGSGDLSRIAVTPRSRRRGIARRLLDAVIEQARLHALDQVLLEVAADNDAALSLYAAKGFKEIDRRLRYYAGDRDAIVMGLAVAADDDVNLAGDGRDG